MCNIIAGGYTLTTLHSSKVEKSADEEKKESR
jgi:hypothetical protein